MYIHTYLGSVTILIEDQYPVIGHFLCLKKCLQLTKMLEVLRHVCSKDLGKEVRKYYRHMQTLAE